MITRTMPTVRSIAKSAICVPKSERSIVPGLVPGPNNADSMCGAGLFVNRWLSLWFVYVVYPCCALSLAEPFTGYAGTCLNGTCHSGSIFDTAEVTHHIPSPFQLKPR